MQRLFSVFATPCRNQPKLRLFIDCAAGHAHAVKSWNRAIKPRERRHGVHT
jgi:hypothetical protein